MNKLLAILLCFSFLLTGLVSCGGSVQDASSGTTTSSSTSTSTQKPSMDYPIEVDYSYELVEPKKDPVSMTADTKTYFNVKTNKKPYEYTVGEDVIFTVALRTFSGTGAACEYFHVTLRHDGTGEIEDFYIDGSTGSFTLTTQIAEPGYVMMYIWACNSNKLPYANAERACVGAGAQLDEIDSYGSEPEDFDEYWEDKIDGLLDIDPEIIKFELYESRNGYDIYNVRILAVDDSEFYRGTSEEGNPHNYVAGLLAIPQNAKPGTCKLTASFHGHGVGSASIADYLLVDNTILFDVIAHSIDAVEEDYDHMRYNVIGNYGIEYADEDDPDEVYYNNMILRDLQALRFLASYFGSDEGGNLWNGVDFTVNGYSQGGFQSCAVAALASQVGIKLTHAQISAPWLCDIGSYSYNNTKKIKSNFWPKGEYELLAYFDAIWFAKRIDFPADVNVGLGDETTLAAGVTILYNNLATTEKTLTLIQNKGHGSVTAAEKDYVIKFEPTN